jgi:hypothetical protein
MKRLRSSGRSLKIHQNKIAEPKLKVPLEQEEQGSVS